MKPPMIAALETTDQMQFGELIDGRFRCESVAGAGGMGVVYKARDLHLEMDVAVKVLRVGGASERVRFVREATALASLQHPNIVRHIAHGLLADGMPYLVMEWLHGEDLAHRLFRNPLTIPESLTVVRLVAEALAEAHARGIIHRDIKPQNLFLVDGQLTGVRIVDFGLVLEEEQAVGLTQPGTVMGTPGYMSPEQAQGACEVDARSDIFSLGCVLFECLTGVRPFGGDSVMAALSSLLLTQPPGLRTVCPQAPLSLEALLARMLEKEPGRRPADGHAVAFELRGISVHAGLIDGESLPGEQVFSAELSRTFSAPATLVWALLADTDRWNRLNKMPRTRYQYAEEDVSAPGVPVRIGHAEILGTESRWLEVGECIEGQFLLAERRFIVGPFLRTGCLVEVDEEGAGCTVRFKSYVVGDARLPAAAGEMARSAIAHRLGRYLDAVQRLIARSDLAWLTDASMQAPAAQARRLLLSSAPDPIVHGPVGTVRTDNLMFRQQGFAAAPVAAAILERILTLVSQAPDDLIRQIRPYELAQSWALPPRDVLLGFVYATRAGLTDLRWQLICPRCRVSAAEVDSITAIKQQVHCSECQIEFDADLAANIEAVFQINRAIREVDTQLYCAGSASHRPHLMAHLRIPPQRTRTVKLALPTGAFLARVLRPAAHARFAVSATAGRGVAIRVSSTGIDVQLTGSDSVTICNETDSLVAVQLERESDSTERALCIDLANLAEFHELFCAEAPAMGLDLRVSTVTLLQLELCGAAELCVRLGDANGFAVLQKQLAQLTDAIKQHQGGVLRVQEETLTACFPGVLEALRAVHEGASRVRSITQKFPELSVRAGIYEGPCLAVRSQERLDFFGSGPKLATRQTAQLAPWRLWISPRIFNHPEIRQLLPIDGEHSSYSI